MKTKSQIQTQIVLVVYITISDQTNMNNIISGQNLNCYYSMPNYLKCWGANQFGELNIPISIKSQILMAISIGREFMCIVTTKSKDLSGGDLTCWGRSDLGQSTVHEDQKEKVQFISAGDQHSCALRNEKNVWVGCWGDSSHGQTNIPDEIRVGVIHVQARNWSTCILNQIDVLCYGQMDQRTLQNKPTKFKYALGTNHICVQTDDEKLLSCKGHGEGIEKQISQPIHLKNTKLRQIVAQGDHTCGIQEQIPGKLECWGANDSNQLDVDREGVQDMVATGHQHSCALLGMGQIKCWGTSQHFLNRVPDEVDTQVHFITTFADFTCVIVGGALQCIGKEKKLLFNIPSDLKQDSIMATTGTNHICAQQNYSFERNSKPVIKCWGVKDPLVTEIPNLNQDNATDISAGYKFTCMIVTMDRATRQLVTCWGVNNANQLEIPEDSILYDYYRIKTGAAHACAVSVDESLACWGLDEQGQTNIPDSLRQEVEQVGLGFQHTCASKSNGQVGCWGHNNKGQADVPQIQQFKVQRVQAGGSHSCALMATRQLFCWGSNEFRQLKVPSKLFDSVKQVVLGKNHTAFSTVQGKMKCYGDNSQGQCGKYHS